MANPVELAVRDIVNGARLAPLWTRLGWEQTAIRFRRTLLGPFWLSANLLATSIALTFVFGALLGANWRETFPLIISGLLVWSLLGGVVGEAAGVFIGSAGQIQTQKLPLTFYIYLMMQRTAINFAAQLITLWVVLLCMQEFAFPTWPLLLALPLVLACGFFASIIVAIPSTRFRDINQMTQFFMQIMFFVTPIFWFPGAMAGPRRMVVDYNPLAHMLELIRQPLLGRIPAVEHWIWTIGTLLVLAVIATIVLAVNRKRIVFWL